MRKAGGIKRFFALIQEELFWRYWVRTKGLKTPLHLASLLQPKRPFPAEFVKYINKDENNIVLDVGSGPITYFGDTLEGYQIKVTATDILADKYNKLLARAKITPPIKTVFADAEHLSAVFEENSRTLVHANNSLDHCQTPIAAISEMIKVAKSGGTIFLRHRKNEAVRAKYRGLHQWNFDLINGIPVLWNRSTSISLSEIFGDLAKITVIPDEEHLVLELIKR